MSAAGERPKVRPAEPTDEESSPRKRPKQESSSAVNGANDAHASRRGRSCSQCRRLKVKCDLGENGRTVCTRCTRLELQCLSERKTWMSADRSDRQSSTELVVAKLERAMRDVLEKLNLPDLELYAQSTIVEHFTSPKVTRPKSPEPTTDGADISPGPMSSLIDVTRISGLRTQLRSVKQRRRGGYKRMDFDLVSKEKITLAEAEEMLAVFHTRLSHHLSSARVDPSASLDDIRKSSTVLFTAIMMVSALHIPGKEQLHKDCHEHFLALVSSAIFDHLHSLDDIRGLCIAAFWQPDLTWKLSGIAIRMATELNLHHAFHEAFHTPDLSDETRKDCIEKARIWYFLYLLDHTSSIAYGRPPVMAELRPIKDYETLLRSAESTPADRELLAIVSGCAIVSRAFELFGLEPKRSMVGDDAHVLNHLRFVEDLDTWRDKWVMLPERDPAVKHDLTRGVELHYYFSQLVLNALVIRGRELDSLQNLPSGLRPFALRAIKAAHAILEHFTDEPSYRDALVGMPLYLHSMIAFAVVFLMRLSIRWHTIGISISPSERTFPLIEGIINLLRECKAGAAHMVFSMANGFERMLNNRKQLEGGETPYLRAQNGNPPGAASRPNEQFPPLSAAADVGTQQRQMYLMQAQARAQAQQAQASDHRSQGYSPQDTTAGGKYAQPPHSVYGNTNGPDYPISNLSDFSHGPWDDQDKLFWSLGMGWDLLAPNDQGMQDADFPSYASSSARPFGLGNDIAM